MHTWKKSETCRWLILNANSSYAVKVTADRKGHLWVAGRKYGHAATIHDAQDWAETLFENDQLPGHMRPVHTGNRNPG